MSATTSDMNVLHSQPTDADRFLPEGPRAIVLQGRDALAWVNIQTAPDATRGAIHVRYWDNGQTVIYPQARRPGFLFPTDVPDTFLVGMEKDLGTLNLATGVWTTLATIDDTNARTIINDGEIVPGGQAIVFGTKDVLFAAPLANLYLFTLADRRCTVLADQQTCSNGKVFHTAGEKLFLYDIDTPQRCVVRYTLHVQSRQATERTVVLDLQQMEGFPDGMVDGGDGTVLIAFYHPTSTEAGHVRRYHLPTGRIVEEWRTPYAPRVTCPLLVEHQENVQLLCTTATEGMSATMFTQCPNSGNLFSVPTTLKQLPTVEIVRL